LERRMINRVNRNRNYHLHDPHKESFEREWDTQGGYTKNASPKCSA